MSGYQGRKVRITQLDGKNKYKDQIGTIADFCPYAAEGDDTRAVSVILESGIELVPYLPGARTPECEWVDETPVQDKYVEYLNQRIEALTITHQEAAKAQETASTENIKLMYTSMASGALDCIQLAKDALEMYNKTR